MRYGGRVRAGIVALGLLWFSSMAPSQGFQQQRAQVSVFIQVSVVPGPLGSIPAARQVGFNFGGRAKGSGPAFDAMPLKGIVAATQGSAPVQANIQANPTGNLLTTNPSSLTITQGRGTAQTYACAFNLAITTTITSWTLDTGLNNDFDPTFPGNDLAWSMYVGAPPSPQTFTPYKVYPNNNNTWGLASTGSGNKNYCVDLQLTIPQSVPLGTYNTSAVYTLFY